MTDERFNGPVGTPAGQDIHDLPYDDTTGTAGSDGPTDHGGTARPHRLVRPDSPTFADLGARPETVEALASIGVTHTFAIQEYALPIAMRGSDLIGQAPTGTGKTYAFGVPILERVRSRDEGADGDPQALVVVPTRELGLQVAKDIESAGRLRGVRVLPVYGGVAYEPQIAALRDGVEVVVGTPGRLLDLARQGHLRLHRVGVLVLDEADRMLDLGFLDDVEQILALLPEQRQTMLFSATMPEPIVALARRFMRAPVTVHASWPDQAGGGAPQTRQIIYRTHPLNKIEMLARILQARDRGLTMIFARTKRGVDKVTGELDFRGFAVASVHGDMGQAARERALRAFRKGKVDVLVATDVAARGLDVSGVTHVVNYDCPEDADTYTHRIGRTGRAGASGVAVTFVDWEDLARWKLIDKTLGLEVPDPPETYHTSPWLYTDLDIPEDADGELPPEQRKRAGLAAEAEEDLGGPSGRRAEPNLRRGRRRRRGGADDDPQAETGPSPAAAAVGAADEPDGTRRRRRRRRRRGATVGAESVDSPVTDTGADTPHAGDDPVVDGPTADVAGAAGAITAAGGDGSARRRPRRRRRRRDRAGADQPTPVAAGAVAASAKPAGEPSDRP